MKPTVMFCGGAMLGMALVLLLTYRGIPPVPQTVTLYQTKSSDKTLQMAQRPPPMSSTWQTAPQTATASASTSASQQASEISAAVAPASPQVPDREQTLRLQKEMFAKLEYPGWWKESWPKSEVSRLQEKFVGAKPLFASCNSHPDKSGDVRRIEPHAYLANSKNPCWYEMAKAKKNLRCVPYVYLAGVAKCGTTDLARRLHNHSDVFLGTSKEYHWWERERFGSTAVSFSEYIDQITGTELQDLEAELSENKSSVRIFGDFSPSYFWDPRHWQDLEGNDGCREPRIIHAQHIRHLYQEAKIILTFRHPTPRLYSRFLSRIPRTPELSSATAVDFHEYVVDGIKKYKSCFRKWSIRSCAYNATLYRDVVVRLVEGMYPVFMSDWLRVWPRHQMFMMRYEDYGGHEIERLAELIQFLRLTPRTNKEIEEEMGSTYVFNSGREEYDKYGSMLPETRKALDDFYQPFVNKFADLLQDQRFLWLDVDH